MALVNGKKKHLNQGPLFLEQTKKDTYAWESLAGKAMGLTREKIPAPGTSTRDGQREPTWRRALSLQCGTIVCPFKFRHPNWARCQLFLRVELWAASQHFSTHRRSDPCQNGKRRLLALLVRWAENWKWNDPNKPSPMASFWGILFWFIPNTRHSLLSTTQQLKAVDLVASREGSKGGFQADLNL